MSHPGNDWLIEQIEKMLEEIANFAIEVHPLTNSKKDCIVSNTEMIRERIYELKLEKK